MGSTPSTNDGWTRDSPDYVGSTSGMIRHVDETRPERVVMVTECSMSDNVAVAHPEVELDKTAMSGAAPQATLLLVA